MSEAVVSTKIVRAKPPAAGKGRPKGCRNKTTVALKEAILLAAQAVGQDDKGKGGLQGYLQRVAKDDVKAFSSLLGRVLPVEARIGDPDGKPLVQAPPVFNVTVKG